MRLKLLCIIPFTFQPVKEHSGVKVKLYNSLQYTKREFFAMLVMQSSKVANIEC